MKKIIAIIVGIVMALSMVACSDKTNDPSNSGSNSKGSVQVPNPFVTCKSLDEASDIAGFNMNSPENIPNWVNKTTIRAVKDSMIEIIYSGDDENKLCIRKALGNEDISGDYNNYEKTTEIEVDNFTVTVKGNGENINVATWILGEYSFALTSNIGITQEDLTFIISTIK